MGEVVEGLPTLQNLGRRILGTLPRTVPGSSEGGRNLWIKRLPMGRQAGEEVEGRAEDVDGGEGGIHCRASGPSSHRCKATSSRLGGAEETIPRQRSRSGSRKGFRWESTRRSGHAASSRQRSKKTSHRCKESCRRYKASKKTSPTTSLCWNRRRTPARRLGG